MTYKLLFVCLGNICRSPAAENIINHLLSQESPEIQALISCDSAGTSAYHIGESPDRRMVQAAKKRDMDFTGKGRQFTRSDFEEFDLILAMDRDNYYGILSLDPSGKYQHKVKMICDYCTEHTIKEVPDPYYGGPEGFNHVIDLLIDGCSGLLKEVKEQIKIN
jgi:protein-tyrosine phosphatase